jgi:hypothetical protein
MSCFEMMRALARYGFVEEEPDSSPSTAGRSCSASCCPATAYRAAFIGAGEGLSTAMVQAGSLLGPALGGALVATTRASTAAFAVDATSFGISALTLLLIPRGAAADAGEEVPAGGVLALLGRSRRLQVLLWW